MPAYSQAVKICLALSGKEALVARQPFIYPLHLLIGLAKLESVKSRSEAERLGVTLDQFISYEQELELLLEIFAKAKIEPQAFRRRLRALPPTSRSYPVKPNSHIGRAPITRTIFGRAGELAEQRQEKIVTTLYLLSALLEHPENWLPPDHTSITFDLTNLREIALDYSRPLHNKDQYTFNESISVDKIIDDSSLVEPKHLNLVSKISRRIEEASTLQSLLERTYDVLREDFPKLARLTIALGKDGQSLLPEQYYPQEKSYLNFSLATYALNSKKIYHWNINSYNEAVEVSSGAEGSVLYAPILSMGEVIGVLHLESNSTAESFTHEEMQLAGLITNILAAGIKVRETHPLRPAITVFISYAREEAVFVDRFQADLRQYRIKVWFDRRLQGGENWSEKIDEALRNSNVLLLVMSQTSVGSKYVMEEVQKALDMGILVIPLLFEPCHPPKIVEHLQRIKIGDAYYGAGLQSVISILLNIRVNPA